MKPEFKEALCIKVPKTAGEFSRKKLIELHLLDNNLKIKTENEYILIPISGPIEGIGKLEKSDFEILKKKITVHQVAGAYELIGDIAIIDQHENNPWEISTLLLSHNNINTVFQAKSAVSGEYRTRDLAFMAGEKKYHTIYRENGCRYLLDVTQVYFTPRLASERMRIAEQITVKDRVVDMFCGIGPFSILIAKKYPGVHVIAIDKNPVAIQYLRENVRLNKVNNIEIREGDARDEVKGISDANHVIMNLPHSGLEFLDSAFSIIKRGGIIHFYAISHKKNLFDALIKEIEGHANNACFQVCPVAQRIVRPYAPYQYHVCIDIKVK